METTATAASAASASESRNGRGRGASPYDQWIESVGIPIHRGYYIQDLRTIELGRWQERGCDAAFLVLAGQEGVQESRVTEVPPGATLPPVRMALEEIVYVVSGHGLTTVWGEEGQPRRMFEWQPRSMFMIPPNCHYELSNVRSEGPARLLHVNYLPLAMSLMPNPDFYFNNPVMDPSQLYGEENVFSEAKVTSPEELNRRRGLRYLWVGNFFPDMGAWDRLEPHRTRGAGGTTVYFRSTSGMGGHMSVFPSRTYKLAHRHGPGFVIVIPGGEGLSIMWREGEEKVVIHWREGSMFVPPNQWYHQHFNLGADPARYLAFTPPRALMGTGDSSGQRTIAYVNEDPMVRETFEAELAKRGLTSLMPDEVYTNPDYKWAYSEDQD